MWVEDLLYYFYVWLSFYFAWSDLLDFLLIVPAEFWWKDNLEFWLIDLNEALFEAKSIAI